MPATIGEIGIVIKMVLDKANTPEPLHTEIFQLFLKTLPVLINQRLPCLCCREGGCAPGCACELEKEEDDDP